MNHIDVFTVWHIKLLRFFSNLRRWFKENGKKERIYGITTMNHILEDAYPVLRGKSDMVNLILFELVDKQLLKGVKDVLDAKISGFDVLQKRTTELVINLLISLKIKLP